MNSPLLHLASALALNSLPTLLLGILVYLRKRNNRIGTIFLFYSLSISWWSFFQIWHMSSADRASALLWARIMEAGAFFIPTLFVHFISLLLELKTRRWILRGLYPISAMIAALSMT